MGRLRDAFKKAGVKQAKAMMGAIYLAPLFSVALYVVLRFFPFRPIYGFWLFFTLTAVVLLLTVVAVRFSKPMRHRRASDSVWQVRELRITTLDEARRQA